MEAMGGRRYPARSSDGSTAPQVEKEAWPNIIGPHALSTSSRSSSGSVQIEREFWSYKLVVDSPHANRAIGGTLRFPGPAVRKLMPAG